MTEFGMSVPYILNFSMNSKPLVSVAVLLLFPISISILAAEEPDARSISENCAELPFNSFPPNQLLRQENSDGSAVSLLQAGKIGTWGEVFIQIDKPGTYRVEVGLLKGPNKGTFQLQVNGDPVGEPADCYSSSTGSSVVPVGEVTFLEPANNSFRFRVTGKNASSSGLALALASITLTPATGFTLLSPNGSCQSDGNVLLRWNPWSEAGKYQVEVDGSVVNTVDAPATSWQTSSLAQGPHRWRVIAAGTDGKLQPSNFFSFSVGTPPPYPCREFSDDFSSPHPDDWVLQSMKFSQNGGNHSLEGTAPGSAVQKTVHLDKTEAELSVKITPGTDSVTGVGFQAEDGTQLLRGH